MVQDPRSQSAAQGLWELYVVQQNAAARHDAGQRHLPRQRPAWESPALQGWSETPRDTNLLSAGAKQGAAEETRLLRGAVTSYLICDRGSKLSVRFGSMALGARMTAPGRQLRLARMHTIS